VRDNTTILLSFDPGTQKTGYAVFYAESLIEHGTLINKKGAVDISSITAIFTKHPITDVAIEDQYMRSNFYSAKQLSAWRGMLEGIARSHGITHIHKIYPKTWQSTTLGKGCGQLKREYIKKASKRTAEMLYNVKNITIDEADAILIGTHVVRRLHFERTYIADR